MEDEITANMDGSPTAPDGKRHRYLLEWVFISWGLILAAMHAYAAFVPSGSNWGFHHLAFLPTILKVLVPFLMVAALIPTVRRRVVALIESAISRFDRCQKRSKRGLVILTLVSAGILLWIAREGTTFLGDGFVLIHRIPTVTQLIEIPLVSLHEPLTCAIVWRVYQVLTALHIGQGAALGYAVVSIACGFAFFLTLYFFIRSLILDPAERVLSYLFLLVTGGTQLFFGYMENYSPAYYGLLLFVLLSFLCLKGKVHLAVPSAVLACLYLFYFGMIAFSPALAVLYYQAFRRRDYRAIMFSMAGMAVTIVLLLYTCGYDLELFGVALNTGNMHVVPLFTTSNSLHAYTLLSPKHFVDLFNVNILMSPYSMVILVVLFSVRGRALPWAKPEWIFIMLLALCGLGMTVLFNCDLSMSRDWDLLSTFVLASVLAAVYGWTYIHPDGAFRKQMLAAMTIITFLHTAPWVGVNTRDELAIERLDTLMSGELWGKFAYRVTEEVAIYYRSQSKYEKASYYYKYFLSKDSTNARVWGDLGDMHAVFNNGDKAQHCYERAVEFGSPVWQVYTRLGTLYGKQMRYRDAIPLMQKSLTMNPHQPDVINSIGVFILNDSKSCKDALPYYLSAIREDSTYIMAYKNASWCFWATGDVAQAKGILQRYLQICPNANGAEQVRGLLQSMPQPTPAKQRR